MIQNPILKGFCPDPCIVRAGDDYYIATSTFEWWPGVKLFHSKDLQNWKQIISPLRSEKQLSLIGDPTSGGVWAPGFSCDKEKFYLVYTDVKTKKGRYYNTHNYLIYTDDLYKEWSEPVYLNSVGFDADLFHDTDGKKYLVNMLNGFKGITLTELDTKTFHPLGKRKLIYQGSGIGCTEGPHLYHIGAWYYLLTAEGGTGYDHCVTIARSENIWGPYITAPSNPILTSDRHDMNALQKCGHAALMETQYGEWYMVHLCSRPLRGEQWCNLGRETAIQKIIWEDGWPRLACGGIIAQNSTAEPIGIFSQENIESQTFFDDFNECAPDVRYSSPRADYRTFASCRERKGYLRMYGQESMNSLHHVSLLAVRQQAVNCTAETAMDFLPEYEEQLAGLSYMYDAMHFYIFGKTADEENNAVLVLIKSDGGIISDEIDRIRIPAEGTVVLRCETVDNGQSVIFSYAVDDEWVKIDKKLTTQIMTDEHCRGFTGAHFGMYVHDMTGEKQYADFDYFSMKENNRETVQERETK